MNFSSSAGSVTALVRWAPAVVGGSAGNAWLKINTLLCAQMHMLNERSYAAAEFTSKL